MTKIIATVMVCLFLVNDIAWAHPDAGASKDALAVSSQLASEEFKERFMARACILGHKAANEAIRALIKTDKGRYKDQREWEEDRTDELDIADPGVRGNIGAMADGVKKVKLVKVTDLFKKTGQFAHAGLSGKYELDGVSQSYGMPVFYVDDFYFDKADRAALRHEIDEIMQWEELRSVIAGARGVDKSKVDMRRWIKDHVSREDKGLYGTRYGGMTSIAAAKYIHGRSHPLAGLYKAAGLDAAGALSRLLDMDYIRKMYDIDEEGRDVNIAAGGGLPVPQALIESAELLRPDTPPDNIYRWLKFNDVPIGSEMTAVWGENVNAESLAKYHLYLKERLFPQSAPMTELYLHLLFLNIVVSTLGISSSDVRNRLVVMFIRGYGKKLSPDVEDEVVRRAYAVWKNSDLRDRDLPGDITRLFKTIKASCAGLQEAANVSAFIISRAERLAAFKEPPAQEIGKDEGPDGAGGKGAQNSRRTEHEKMVAHYSAVSDEEAVAEIKRLGENIKILVDASKRTRSHEANRMLNDLDDHIRAALEPRLNKRESAKKICDAYLEVMREKQITGYCMEHYPSYAVYMIISDLRFGSGDYGGSLELAKYGLNILERTIVLLKRESRTVQVKVNMSDIEEDRRRFKIIMARANLRLHNFEEASRLGLEIKNEVKEIIEKDDFRKPDHCANYCETLFLLINLSVERASWEDARRYTEELLRYSHRANLSYDNKERLLNTYVLAGDVYLRGVSFFRDIDALSAARLCAETADKVVPGAQETAVLRAWIKFEEADMEGALRELRKVSRAADMDSKPLIMYIRLARALAMFLYNNGREEEAREVCANAMSNVTEQDRQFIGMRSLLSGLLTGTRGYDAASDDIAAVADESRKTDQLVISTLMSQAFINMGRAMRNGGRIAVYDGTGALNDYARNCLEAFEYNSFSVRVVEAETRVNSPDIKDGITALLKLMAKEGDLRISFRTRYRILHFLEYMRKQDESPAWVIAQLERLLSEMRAPSEAVPGNGSGGKKEKGAAVNEYEELRRQIKVVIEDAARAYFAGERLERAQRMFDSGAYEDVLAEIEAGLKAADGPDDALAKDRLNTYKEASSCALQAQAVYLAQRFRMARLQYEKAARALETAGAAPGAALSDGFARARKMVEAEEAYESGDFDRALQIAGEVNDAPGNGFARRITRVRTAETGQNPGAAMINLAKEFPSDARVKAFFSNLRAAKRVYKTNLTASNDIMQEVRNILLLPDITAADLLRVVGDLKNIRELLKKAVKGSGGYSNAFGSLVRDAAKISYSRGLYDPGIYRISLRIAQFGLSVVPQDSRNIRAELAVIARDAKAQMASAKLHRQYEILDCHFQADNLRTKKKLSERGTLDYKFSDIKKSEDGATLEISGLSYDTAGGAPNEITDARTAVSRGESYVLITENSEGRMVQFVLKAVSVYGPVEKSGERPGEKSRAVFKLECDEAARSAFAGIPERPGVLKKLNDPSLKDRRDAVFECMTQLDNSLALGAKPASGNRFADMLLELEPPSGNDVKQANIDFRDERLAKDTDQKKAVEASLDEGIPMTLTQGPPGTGKTSVIVEIIRQFRARGKKILVVSQSNAAVDNVAKRLLAIQAEGETLTFARVGNNKDAVDPDVYKSGAYSNKKKVLEEMRAARAGCVVLGTIGGFSSDGDMKKMEHYSKFDLVIVEEAGRATLAETLVPLGRVNSTGKVVLVGDHNQLPPYGIDETQIEETKEELEKYMYKKDRLDEIFSAGKIREFKTSPFEILWEYARGFKEGVHRHFLSINRRSVPVITDLVSRLFYHGRIMPDPEKSGVTPEEDTLKLIDYTQDEPLTQREDRVGKSYSNLREVDILLDEFDRILNQPRKQDIFDAISAQPGEPYRYDIKDITIITPFAPQRALIREAFEIKAIINKLLRAGAGGAATEAAITEDEARALNAALKPGSNEAEAAIRTLARSNPAGEAGQRLARTIARAFIFDVSLKHGQRSVMPEDLEKLGLLEIETVDSIQGSENKVVILSLVRSNTIGQIGFMGTDDGLQRLNVAFSRAQEKFIIIGDFTNTLTQARYTPRNPNPRSWFQRARRESTGRAQIVFKETVKYYKEFRDSLGRPPAPPAAVPEKREEKGSPAKFLETVRDRLMGRAMSEDGFVFKDIAPLRKYHPATVYKEIRILVSLGVIERIRLNGKTRFRFSAAIRALDPVRAAALIETINNIEHRIGRKDNPLDRYEIPDPGDVELVKELIRNAVGVETAKRLTDTLPPAVRGDGRYYVVRYNDGKLKDYAMKLGMDPGEFRKLFEMYVRSMRLRLGGADKVDDPKPTSGENQPLISIECYSSPAKTGATLIGKGRIDIAGGAIDENSTLRIIDMANMAFAMSNIPLGADVELDGYGSCISFIRDRYKELTGKEPPEDLLSDDRTITLPAIRRIPLNKLREYYEFTVRQLAQAA